MQFIRRLFAAFLKQDGGATSQSNGRAALRVLQTRDLSKVAGGALPNRGW
jgi:hypothetical protein